MVFIPLFLASISAWTQQVPAELMRFMELDQNYNIYSRENGPFNLTAEQKRVLPISAIWTNLEDIEANISEHTPKEYTYLFKDNNQVLLLVNPYKELQQESAERSNYHYTNTLSSVVHPKRQGSGTTLVFDDISTHTLFVKFFDAKSNVGRMAVDVNDVTHKSFALHGNPRNFEFLEEFAYFGTSNYAVIYRSAVPIQKALAEGFEVVPLHGIFGCEDCLREAIKGSELDIEQWKLQVYQPALAKLMAEMLFRYGWLQAMHTQNAILVLNKGTGQIEKFIVKDLQDMGFDYNHFIRSKLDINYDEFAKIPFDKVGVYFRDKRAPEAMDVGYHMAIYLGQSIMHHYASGEEKLKAALAFVEAHLPAAKEESGIDFNLEGEALKAYESLKAVVTGEKGARLYTGNLKKRSKLQQNLALIFQGVYNQISSAKMFLKEAKIDAHEQLSAQSALKIIMQSASLRRRVTYTSDQSRSRAVSLFGNGALQMVTDILRSVEDKSRDYAFYYEKGRVYLLRKSDRAILAMTIGLLDHERASLMRLGLLKESECENKLER